MKINELQSAICLDHVSKHYKQGKTETTALRDVTLAIPRGRFVAIMGASGSGKSTLLHIIGGLTTPTNGNVEIFGERLHEKSDSDLTRFRREHIGLIFQAFNLLPTMNALKNVCLPRIIGGERANDVQDNAEKLLKMVGLGDRTHHYPDELSGGQQQRVAIARALITKPPLLLADEPTGNLDSKTGDMVLQLLKRLSSNHEHTVVMVTHDPKAATYADQIITLKDGQLLES